MEGLAPKAESKRRACCRGRVLAGVAGLATCLGLFGSPALAAGTAPANATELMVADFNSGAKPDNLGGDFGCWIKDPNDPMQGCIESFDQANRFGSSGYALRLIYSVELKKPAFGGLWMRLRNLDSSTFDSFAFRVKGDARMGFTTVFKVELKDSVGQASSYYVRGVTDQWQNVVVPLNDFKGMANFRSLDQFVIVFEDTTATAKRGVIYVDDVRNSSGPPERLRRCVYVSIGWKALEQLARDGFHQMLTTRS